MKDEDLLSQARARFKQAELFEKEDRDLAADDLSFAAGEQWDESIKRDRQRQGRPCLTTNRLPQFIRQVVGDARQNSPAIKVHPVDDDADIDVAAIYEGLIRNIEGQSSAHSAYMTAFEHAVRGGMGHWRVTTEYADDDAFEQDIRIRRINNPFAVHWDPNAKREDKSDAKWCFVSEWISKESFEEQWPDATPQDWEGDYKQNYSGHTTYWLADDRVRIAEYWVKEPIKKTLGLLENGAVIEITDIKEFTESGLIPVVSTRDTESHVVKCYKLSGHAVLEKAKEFPSKHIPVVSVFGPEEFIGDRVRHISLIRHAKDPQRMYNYWQTTIAEKIALAPKAPFIGTTKQFAGHEREWDSANVENRSRLTYTAEQGVPPPQRSEPAHLNPAELAQSAQAIDDLKATMGMYDASLGNQGNETSGKAIIARQREGDTSTFTWVDNLARAVEYTGRILVDMIPRVYDTKRIVRVLGEDDSVKMVEINQIVGGEMVNDLTVGKYDVVISVGPSYATRRSEAADSLMQFVQAVPSAAQVAGDLIAKSMDWPMADEMAKRLKKLLPPGMEDIEDLDPEEQQAVQEAQQKAMQEEAEAKEIGKAGAVAEIQLKGAQAEKTRADVELLQAQIHKMHAEAMAQEIENEAVLAGIMQFGPVAHTQVDNGQAESYSSRAQ